MSTATTIPPAEWMSYEQPPVMARRARMADQMAVYLSTPSSWPERRRYTSRLLFTIWRVGDNGRSLRNRVMEADRDE